MMHELCLAITLPCRDKAWNDLKLSFKDRPESLK